MTQNKSVYGFLQNRLTIICLFLSGFLLFTSSIMAQNNTSTNKQTRTVKGFVYETSGAPLAGATVFDPKTNVGTVTDADGYYQIKVSETSSQLEFRFIGYVSKKVNLGNLTAINVTLQSETSELDEVVVVGYGIQKKASVVGSVSTISVKDLDVPSANLSNAFAGRLAGVIAVQRSGEPGADGSNFWIRGISSFNSGAQSPLIILDGVKVGTGELNALDPEMIESFSVLKDASASALYGTRGANGVMIVNTKTGLNIDKPIINFRMESSYNSAVRAPEFVDGVDYMNMYNEAVLTRGGSRTLLYSDDKIRGTRLGGNQYVFPNVNWYDEMFREGSFSQNMNFSVRGGGAKVDYFTSVSVNHDNGMLKNTDDFSYNSNISNMRYALQNNINAKVSKTTKLSLNLNATIWDNHGPNAGTQDIFNKIMDSNPVDFPIRFPQDDNYNYITWGGKKGGRYNNSFQNPYAEMATGYSDKFMSSITGTLGINQELDVVTKGLSFNGMLSFKNYSETLIKRSGGYNQFEIKSYAWNQDKTDAESYETQRIGQEQSTALNSEIKRAGDYQIYIQAMLNYNRTFGKHDVSGMFLYNQEESAGSEAYPFRKQGIAGRVTYAYDYKYLFEANFGYNGSENFAPGHRFGFFPSLGVGYTISRENFFKPLTKVINNLKIRGSWGLAGNDQTDAGRFLYRSEVQLQEAGLEWVTGRDQNTALKGPKYIQYGNPNIGWEIGEKINAGVDISLLNCLNLTFDFFKETRESILMKRSTVPGFIGLNASDRWVDLKTNIYGNLGIVENKGFDFAVDYFKAFSKDFSISIKGTFTYAANKIVEYDEADFMLYPNLSRIGRPVNQQLLYVSDRLFIDQAEIDNSPKQLIGGNILPGDIKYINQPNAYGEYDNSINSDDRIYTGAPTVPEIVYGFGPSIQYKNWDFSFFFQGVARTTLMVQGVQPFGTDYSRNVQTFVAEDYWSENNQNIYAAYPRLSRDSHSNTSAASTYWQRDGSYLKLKNLELGYTYKKLRVYARGSNLLIISKFKLWDPEQGSGSGLMYPNQRVVSLGVQLKFN